MVKFPKRNASGLPDPTAHDALLPIAQVALSTATAPMNRQIAVSIITAAFVIKHEYRRS